MTTANTVSVTVDGLTYFVSCFDEIRVRAGEVNWNQDGVTGPVDVTGCGHYAMDTIEDADILDAIHTAIRRNDYQARRESVRYNSAVQFSNRYGAPIL